MRIIRDRRIRQSRWRHVPEGTPAAELNASTGDAVILALADWRLHKAQWLSRASAIGVRLGVRDDIDAITDDLDIIELVALEFGSFTDGRAYTQARLLRERHGFDGEIRAVGDVTRDRLAIMERCGIDAFELNEGARLEDALEAFSEISDVYQHAADARSPVGSRRT